MFLRTRKRFPPQVEAFFVVHIFKRKMFSFFKKDKGATVSDIVWMNEEQKTGALLKLAQQNPQAIFIAWFDETIENLSTRFSLHGSSAGNIYSAKQVWRNHVEDATVIFVEHFPLRQKEEEVYQRLGLNNVTVHTSLDEPLLKFFGGDRIIDMIKRLGNREDEPIQHSMISSSIKNAQEKISRKVSLEHTARSQGDWLRQNISA